MRRIAIIGAGQSGLQMALGLLGRGYAVTLVSNRTPEQIRAGRVMSSQCMFHTALQAERDLGLNWWEPTCPPVKGIGLAVRAPGTAATKAIDWAAPLTHYAQAVDQRLKMAAWLEEVSKRGGDVQIRDAGIADLDALARTHDLVMLAAGKGEIVGQFRRNAERSPFDRPQRALALTYVAGMTPRTPFSRVCFNVIPGVGEYFVFPALTLGGPCEIMVFEGMIGGPMDCWNDIKSPAQHLQRSLEILEKFLPWEAERCRRVELTDANGILAGRFPPTVRDPVLVLPSGRPIFGMADAVVVNDPITGQGSNNAAKCCRVYMDAILAHGDGPFTVSWMEETFATYWNYARYVTDWTNAMLRPPPPHILELFGAAEKNRAIAHAIADGFDNPPDLFPWWIDPAECRRFIDEKGDRAA